MAGYVGKRKRAYEWKSQMFDKYSDMIMIKGKDRTDEIQFMEFDGEFLEYAVYFVTKNIEYYQPDEITRLQHPRKVNGENKKIHINGGKVKEIRFLLYFGNTIRIIYENGDYQTVDSFVLDVCDKYNKIDKNAYKPYAYTLYPDKTQKENIDRKIEQSTDEEKSGIRVYSYEPDKPVGDIIKYKNQIAYVNIADIGDVEIGLFDYPAGNCHEIHVKKVKGVYRIIFFCYKIVVGIDLGKDAVICSTGRKFELPSINLKITEKFWDIKREWKESVAMQLVLEYDILFLEYLEDDDYTNAGFRDMIEFSDILKDKAELFNKANPTEAYKKEICILKEKYPSTQICHICGYQNKDLQGNLTKRNWMCPYCGTRHDRDINAAINILRKGMEEKMEQDMSSQYDTIDLEKINFPSITVI